MGNWIRKHLDSSDPELNDTEYKGMTSSQIAELFCGYSYPVRELYKKIVKEVYSSDPNRILYFDLTHINKMLQMYPASETKGVNIAAKGAFDASFKGKKRTGVSKWELLRKELRRCLATLPEDRVNGLRQIKGLGEIKKFLVDSGVDVAQAIDGRFLIREVEEFLRQRPLMVSDQIFARRNMLRWAGEGRKLVAYWADDFNFIVKVKRDKEEIKLENILKQWIGRGYRVASERLNGLAVSTMVINATDGLKKPFSYILKNRGVQKTDLAIVQRKVVPLLDHMANLVKEGKVSEAQDFVDKYKDFIVQMFRRGVIDNDFTYPYNNCGVDIETGNIYIFDYGDLSSDEDDLGLYFEHLGITNKYFVDDLMNKVGKEVARYFAMMPLTADDFYDPKTEESLFGVDLKSSNVESFKMTFSYSEDEIRAVFMNHAMNHSDAKLPPPGSIYSVFEFICDNTTKTAGGIIGQEIADKIRKGDDVGRVYSTIDPDIRALLYHLKLIQKSEEDKDKTGKDARYYVPESVKKKRGQLLPILEQFQRDNLRPDTTLLDKVYNEQIKPIFETRPALQQLPASGKKSKPAEDAGKVENRAVHDPTFNSVLPAGKSKEWERQGNFQKIKRKKFIKNKYDNGEQASKKNVGARHKHKIPRLFISELEEEVISGVGIYSPHPGLTTFIADAIGNDLSGQKCLDLGTGTGVLGLIMLKRLAANVVFADIKPQAIDCAKDNAARLGYNAGNVPRLEFICSDLFSGLSGRKFNLVLFTPSPIDGWDISANGGYRYRYREHTESFFKDVGKHLAPSARIIFRHTVFPGDPKSVGRAHRIEKMVRMFAEKEGCSMDKKGPYKRLVESHLWRKKGKGASLYIPEETYIYIITRENGHSDHFSKSQPPAAGTDEDPQKIIQELKEERALIQRVHSEWRPAITIFGSARILADDPMYAKAQEMGAAIYREDIAIRTGAGPSMMEAPLQGYVEERRSSGYAHGDLKTQGIRIKLPFEQKTSSYVEDNYEVNHFITRKMGLYNNCLGIIAFPGGFGTMDELFEVWFRRLPVVLVGTKFWKPIIDVFYDEWRNRGWFENIEFKPLITDSVEEAIRYLRESKGRVIRETPEIMESANRDIESALIRLNRWLPGVTVIGQSDFKKEKEPAVIGEMTSSLLSQGIPVRSGTANHELKVVLEKAAADKKDMLQAVLAVPEDTNTQQLPNRIVTHHISNHHVLLTENSRAFVFLPGRVKTLSRLFDLMAVMQTGKVKKRPIVLIGKEFWQPIKDSIVKATINYPTAQLINPKDADLLQIVDTAEEAIEKLGLSSAAKKLLLLASSGKPAAAQDKVVDELKMQNMPDIGNLRKMLYKIAEEEKQNEQRVKKGGEAELKYYTVTYDEMKIRKDSFARQLLEYYVEKILPMWLSGKDRVKLESSNRQDKGIVWVESYSDRARARIIGEGHVDIDEDISGKALRLIGMLNMAFLASQIPASLSPDRRSEYETTMSMIEKQFREVSDEFPKSDSLQFTPQGIWIKLPHAAKVPLEKVEEYYRLTITQLEQAA